MRHALPIAAVFAAALALAAPAPAQQAQPQAGDRDAAAPAAQRTIPASFHELAAGKLPAVVNIATTRGRPEGPAGRAEGPRLPPGLEDFFRQLPPGLEEFFGPRGGGPRGEGPRGEGPRGEGPRGDGVPPPGPARALGSGFVTDPSGYVVTNNHVVEGADEITVILQDKSELRAELIGRDPRTDLALLKVAPDRPLTALEWGDSDTALVGDWVVAIGNPFGLGGTVTAGIVSARARDINAGPYDDFIQTDAAINRGNSGGPLFDMNGRVIGVNTAIFSPTGGSVGIGFAIPSNIAQDVIGELRETGTVRRGFLGVQIQPVTPEVQQALGLDAAEGALVAAVTPGAPAAAAGVEVGDVIVGFAGRPVTGPRDLTRMVAQARIGEPAELALVRDGERRTLNPRIAQLREDTRTAAADPQNGGAERGGPLGLGLSALTPEAKRRNDLPESATGVLITRVAPDGAAARQGLRVGDVIRRVGRQEVTSPDQVRDAVAAARQRDRGSVLLLRQRGDAQAFVTVPLDGDRG